MHLFIFWLIKSLNVWRLAAAAVLIVIETPYWLLVKAENITKKALYVCRVLVEGYLYGKNVFSMFLLILGLLRKPCQLVPLWGRGQWRKGQRSLGQCAAVSRKHWYTPQTRDVCVCAVAGPESLNIPSPSNSPLQQLQSSERLHSHAVGTDRRAHPQARRILNMGAAALWATHSSN